MIPIYYTDDPSAGGVTVCSKNGHPESVCNNHFVFSGTPEVEGQRYAFEYILKRNVIHFHTSECIALNQQGTPERKALVYIIQESELARCNEFFHCLKQKKMPSLTSEQLSDFSRSSKIYVDLGPDFSYRYQFWCLFEEHAPREEWCFEQFPCDGSVYFWQKLHVGSRMRAKASFCDAAAASLYRMNWH